MPDGALPPFGLEGGFGLALLRAGAVASLLSAFGTLVFGVAVAPRAFAGAPAEVTAPAWRALTRLCRISLLAAFACALAWLVAQAAQLADASALPAALAATPAVLSRTVFGHLVAARLVALLVVLAALGRRPSTWRWRVTTLLCGGVVCLHAGHSHAMAMYNGPSVLLASQVVHLLAAGVWLGGLLPLLLLVRLTPPRTAAAACRWFSPLGQWCIAGIVLSAIWQFCSLIGAAVALIGTAYGWMASLKTLLLVVLLGFAAVNRYRLAPALRGADPALARRDLVLSIALQTLAGLGTVLAAAVLSGLQPAMHVQSVWPFRVRPSLVAVAADASLARAAAEAGAAGLGALGLAALGLARRRLRWPALAAAAMVGGMAASHAGVLFVPAFPTAFYRSPTGFAADSIADGTALFEDQCVRCHGAEGRGDGPDARALRIAPADLTSAHLWMHGDGDLFWYLIAGIEDPPGEAAMPGFAAVLGEEDRWSLIDYIRAHNAGLTYATTGRWSPPVLAPSFIAACNGDRAMWVGEPGGPAWRVVFLGPGQAAPPPLAGLAGEPVVTIMIPPEHVMMWPTPTVCVASDPAIRAAYAVASGQPAARLAGQQAFIDRNGWLRAVLAQGALPAAMLRQIVAQPLPRGSTFAMQHHH
jgi:putative copper export protein/mono/diheme cytochrome c family protein